MSEQAQFYIFTGFVLTYGTLNLHRSDLLNDTVIAASVGLVSAPLFATPVDPADLRPAQAPV